MTTPAHSIPAEVGSRRRWLMSGVALAAAGAGAGLAWWRYRLPAIDEGVASLVWALKLPQPDGALLDLRRFQGRPLVVNFWATWCPPCIEELPLLNDFYRQNIAKGWQVVGIAVDRDEAVAAFLARQPLAFPVAIAGSSGAELGKQLGNLSGGLPFTVVFGADGRVQHRKMGKVSADDLRSWVALASS